MKEIKALSVDKCWTMVSRINCIEHVHIAEEWLLKANITNEEYDDLMRAVAYIYRELSHLPNHRYE